MPARAQDPSAAPSERLVVALGSAGVPVVGDRQVLAGCAVDWTGRWSGPVLALARPRTTEQVVAALAVARGLGVPVQVQGGNTGLVGGSVPDRPSLVLGTVALDGLGPVDVTSRSVVVGAGATASQVDAHARQAGLRLGVDLASRDSATVGGMVATNAGGIGVLAHGMMREQVRGLTAVLPGGAVLDTTGRPRKDNAGYDLAGLVVGSEGTLAVVTRVELALHPDPGATSVGILPAGSLAGAVDLARRVESGGGRLLAAEVVDAAGVRAASRALAVADPLGGRAPWMLLVEVADGGTGDGLAGVGSQVLAVGTSTAERARLWSLREEQTSLAARMAGPALGKLDVAVRLDQLDTLVDGLRRLAARRATLWFFGHALDGNLHVQVVPPPGGDGAALVPELLAHVAALGGAISAEHGIGRARVSQLPLVRQADEIAWMRQIKAGVDPGGMLNPGVLLG